MAKYNVSYSVDVEASDYWDAVKKADERLALHKVPSVLVFSSRYWEEITPPESISNLKNL